MLLLYGSRICIRGAEGARARVWVVPVSDIRRLRLRLLIMTLTIYIIQKLFCLNSSTCVPCCLIVSSPSCVKCQNKSACSRKLTFSCAESNYLQQGWTLGLSSLHKYKWIESSSFFLHSQFRLHYLFISDFCSDLSNWNWRNWKRDVMGSEKQMRDNSNNKRKHPKGLLQSVSISTWNSHTQISKEC